MPVCDETRVLATAARRFPNPAVLNLFGINSPRSVRAKVGLGPAGLLLGQDESFILPRPRFPGIFLPLAFEVDTIPSLAQWKGLLHPSGCASVASRACPDVARSVFCLPTFPTLSFTLLI